MTELNKLPKDELNSVLNTSLGFIVPLILIALVFDIFFRKLLGVVNDPFEFSDYVVLVLLSLVIITIHVYLLVNERKLIKLPNKLSKHDNLERINLLIQKENLESYSDTDGIKIELLKRAWNGFPAYKITLIPEEKSIMLNIRTLPTFQGRVPYNFGLKWIFTKRVLNELA